MKQETKNILFEAWAYSEWQNMLTKTVLEYMVNKVKDEGFGESDILEFMIEERENRAYWCRSNPDWYKKYMKK